MMMTSPDRKIRGIGSTSLVLPPIRNTAAFPSLREAVNWASVNSEYTYEMDTSGDVAHTSERSTCPISVSLSVIRVLETNEIKCSHLLLPDKS